MVEEQLLGFDVRERGGGPDYLWDDKRREIFLLRVDAGRPLSVDTLVWPSLFDTGEGIGFSRAERERLRLAGVPVPAYTGPYSKLWEEAGAMRRYLEERWAGPQPSVIIAISRFVDSALSGVPGYEPYPALPFPAARDPRWERLGYDVGDDSLVSGLSNCGYRPAEAQLLRQQWGSRLNESHLFDDIGLAFQFRSLTDERVPSHSPFYVYGLYVVEILA